MDTRALLGKKRDGGALDPSQIEAFIDGYARGEIPDYVASALLMAIYVHGMELGELVAWTRAMVRSGRVLERPELGRPVVDKHSTGGVGDKASIPLAPAAAACGLAVPMISGRGLGHSGGTLDKLEAIPGLRTRLSAEEFGRVLAEVGVVMGGQTEDLVPADRKLYSLRDVTGLVESIPLVASSILSKKLAEGLDGLVLDVKFGSGAFFPDAARGAELAGTMLAIAAGMGLRAVALQTAMDRPLGRAVGHALEIEESLDCLEGGGPEDLRELVGELGAEMLLLGGLEDDRAAARARILKALDDGSARETFARLVAAQGGDPRALDDRARLPRAPDEHAVEAERAGFLEFRDVRQVGWALAALGGARRRIEDAIDPAVGIVFERPPGAAVRPGDRIARVLHRSGHGLAEACQRLEQALGIASSARPQSALVRERFEATP